MAHVFELRVLAICLMFVCSRGSWATTQDAVESDRVEAYKTFRSEFDNRNYDKALPAAQRVVELTEKEFGSNHPDLVNALSNLGTTQLRLKDYDNAEVSYQKAMRLAETFDGGISHALIQPLLGLGITHQASGDHEAAESVLRRALELSRKLDGLYNPAQLPISLALIDSEIALYKLPDAEREHNYVLQVNEQQFGKTDLHLLPALDRKARWYEMTGRYREALDLHKRALELVYAQAGKSDTRAVGPLRGIGRTYMLEFVHGAEILDRVGAPERPLRLVADTYTPPPTFPGGGGPAYTQPRARGEEALLEALKLLATQTDTASASLRAVTLVELGDYYVVGDQFDKALPRYREAWRQMTTGSSTAAFGEPVRLLFRAPADSWGRRPEPTDTSPASEHFVELEYVVTADGQVEDVRAVSSDVIGATERLVVLAMRKARFRPRFANGEPVRATAQRMKQLVWARDSGDYVPPTPSGDPAPKQTRFSAGPKPEI
jgi:tetratricopeptide (TPR) repeat protein